MNIDTSIKVVKLTGNLADLDKLWGEASAALEELISKKTDMFKLSFGANYSETFKAMSMVSIRSAVWFVAHIILKGRAFQKTMKGAGRSQVGQATSALVNEMNLFLGKGTTGTIAVDLASVYLAPLMCFGKVKYPNEIMDGGDATKWKDLPVAYRWVGSIGAIPMDELVSNNSAVLIAYDNWLQNYIQMRRVKSNSSASDDSKQRTRQQYLRLINAVDEDAKKRLWTKVKTSNITWELMDVKDEVGYFTDDAWKKISTVLN